MQKNVCAVWEYKQVKIIFTLNHRHDCVGIQYAWEFDEKHFSIKCFLCLQHYSICALIHAVYDTMTI